MLRQSDNLNKSPGYLVKKIMGNRLSFPLIILFLVLLSNIATTPDFFSISMKNGLISGYIPNILNNASDLVIVALGMTLVTAVAGGQDISVGATMAVAASFCGLMLNGREYSTAVYHNPYIAAILVGLLGGALCGAFNGFMVAVLRIQPMIASLILFTAGRSLGKLITFGQTVYIDNPTYKYLGFQIPGVPIRTPLFIAILMVAIVTLVLKLTSLRLYVESIGVNASASRLVGFNSSVVKFMAFVICGLLAGVAGLMDSSGVGNVDTGQLGLYIEMDAILAVALGGNLLGGGKFSIAGSVIGAYTIQAIKTTLYAMNVRSDQLNVFKAVIIIIIIVISSDVFKSKFRRLTRRTLPEGI